MITNHVTSLEWSRKLKELGVPQKSEFYWNKYDNPEEWCVDYESLYHGIPEERYSAYLATEILAWLPDGEYCGLDEGLKFLCLEKIGDYWEVGYVQREKTLYSVENKSLPDALAAMLAYLIENGIVKVEDLK